jgi:hypothetical protein
LIKNVQATIVERKANYLLDLFLISLSMRELNRTRSDARVLVFKPGVSSWQFSHANGIALQNVDAVSIQAESNTRVSHWRVVKWR